MSTIFHADQPWPVITAECAKRGPRVVAVAYVGAAAPKMLPLDAGDILVANAGSAALLSHATDPSALQVFRDRGVSVFSVATLHAKVLATRRSAIIGSANASANSTAMSEAVTVTTDPVVVRTVKEYVLRLRDNAREVDDDFLADARAVWAKGRGFAPLGTDASPPPADEGLLPRPLRRVVVQAMAYYTASPSEEQTGRAARRGLPRHIGASGRYYRTWLRYRATSPHPRPGDVVLAVCPWPGEGLWVDPPVVVLKGPVPIPRSRGAVLYVVEADRTLDYVRVDDNLMKAWTGIGVDPQDPRLHRVVTAPLRHTVLLAPWGLTP